MQFDRDEFALLSRAGRVPRMSRAGPLPLDVRARKGRLEGIVAMTRRRVAALRAYRAGVLATWTVFGESQQDR